jgi:hypothetical protein
VVSSSQLYDWCFPRQRKVKSELLRYGVWCVLQTVADPIGRAPTRGRPLIWRLRPDIAERSPPLAIENIEEFGGT